MISSKLKPGNFVKIASLISDSPYSKLPEFQQIILENANVPNDYCLISLSKQPLMMFLDKKEGNKETFVYESEKDKILVLVKNELFYITDEEKLYFGKNDLDI